MIRIVNLKCRSLLTDQLDISWEVDTGAVDALDFTFQILRSESIEGPYDVLTKPFKDRYLFADNQLPKHDRWRNLYYKVRVLGDGTSDYEDFGPVTQEPDTDLIAAELRSHIMLVMREYAGRRCWVLPVRTFGKRCDCFNDRLKKKLRSGCERCFDTTFVRGYLHPIESWISIDPTPNDNQYTNVGPQQQNNSTARMGYYPPLKPNDLVIESENKRWKVVTVTSAEHGRATTLQNLAIHEIPKSDIEYNIPLVIEEDFKSMYFGPPRNFTNPHTLENFEKGVLDDLFRLQKIRLGAPWL